jgi:hypothetical protein
MYLIEVRNAEKYLPCPDTITREKYLAGHQWLTPAILATEEGKNRVKVRSQPRMNSLGDSISKITSPKQKRVGGVVQV